MSVPPRFRSTDSGERDFRSVLGPTGNKLQRKPPGMKLENKKMTTTIDRKKVVRRSGSVSSAVGACAVGRRKLVDEKDDKVAGGGGSNGDCFADGRRRCAWITPKSDPSYVAFHDEEWGFPVHDD
ncbi:hypothetical protein HID58_095011, partial [Brassica napus]